MQFEDIELIRKHMQILVGAQWVWSGRAAAMGTFVFLNKESEYALHVQSAFRIRTEDKLIVANLDMFDPLPEIEGSQSFDWNSYNWDVQGANCYDRWSQGFVNEVENGKAGIVRKIHVNDLGDLIIEIDNGMVIEVFLNSSREECWRFFERESEGHHLVVKGTGLNIGED